MTQSGRAGRDGEPAECILLYGGQDVITNQLFIDNNRDNQELDAVTRAVVQERDRERLRKMTFYCFTNECLRDYILRYFGEYGENYCGNCSNCLSQFETVDVTEIARGIIGCVESSRQRYGTNVIIDTVHGANTAKIRQYHMDENPRYAELAKVPTYKLRQVMNYLQLNDYLAVTNDEYAIVKLTEKSRGVLETDEPVVMKMAKEQEHPAKVKSEKEKKSRKGLAAGLSEAGFTEGDEALFDQLRALRSEIAKEEKVPPYIVFSDKTLAHMCVIKPKTRAEMLSVTGVGAFKFDKYGERFLECIRAETGVGDGTEARNGIGPGAVTVGGGDTGNSLMDESGYFESDDLYFDSDSSEFDDWNTGDVMAAWENGSKEPVNRENRGTENLSRLSPVKEKRSKETKMEFVMTQDLAERLHYSERVSISDFVGQINDLRDDELMKRLTIKSVEEKLVADGLFEEVFIGGMKRKKLTEAGENFGIVAEKRISEKGNEYYVFYYMEKAQKEIVEWLQKAAE